MKNGKPIWKSKTLWFALLTVVIGIASAFGLEEFTPDPEQAALLESIVVIVVGVINLILRYVTSEPVILSTRSDSSKRNHRG